MTERVGEAFGQFGVVQAEHPVGVEDGRPVGERLRQECVPVPVALPAPTHSIGTQWVIRRPGRLVVR